MKNQTSFDRRLRVALFAPHFSEYSYRLAASLSAHCDVILVLNRKDANRQWPLASIPTRAPFDLTIRDFSLRRRGVYGIPLSVLDVLSFKPDIVHCHESPDYYTAGLLEILRFLKVPVALTVHDPLPHSAGGSGTNSLEERLRARMRSNSNVVMLHGSRCISDFRCATPTFKGYLQSAMHGVLMVPRSGAETIERLPGRILFFGRMEAYKGLDVFLSALEILDDRGIRYEAVVAGRGSELTRWRNRMDRNHRITTLEAFVSPSDASHLFRTAEVVALPYRDATQSGVLASAIGNNCVVIASETGGIPDIIQDGENGLLVRPGDPNHLAVALERVLSSEDLRKLLREGAKETARGPLNWDRIAMDVVAGYRMALP